VKHQKKVSKKYRQFVLRIPVKKEKQFDEIKKGVENLHHLKPKMMKP